MTDQQQTAFEASPAPETAGRSLASAIGARNLMIIIVTMPLVFLIVVMATIAIFGRPGADKAQTADAERVVAAVDRSALAQPAPAAPAGVIAPSPASLALAPAPLILPPGADITSMALDGNRLAVRIDGKDGGAIVVYDLASGTAVQSIEIKRQVAADSGEDL